MNDVYVGKINEILGLLSSKEQMLIKNYFGIDNEKETQEMLAKRLGVSQAAISKRVKKILEKIRYILDNNITKENYKTMYQMLDKYSKEDIDKAIGKLSNGNKKVLSLKYGDDLKDPSISVKWDDSLQEYFEDILIPKVEYYLSFITTSREIPISKNHRKVKRMIKK